VPGCEPLHCSGLRVPASECTPEDYPDFACRRGPSRTTTKQQWDPTELRFHLLPKAICVLQMLCVGVYNGTVRDLFTEPAWVGSRDRSFTRSYSIPGKNQFCLPPGTIPIAAEQQWDPTEIPFSPLAEDNLSCDIDGMGTESRSLFDPALPIAGAANFSLSHVASRNAPSPPLQIAQSYLSIGILYANCQPYVRNPE
jgi:hypothetical protein